MKAKQVTFYSTEELDDKIRKISYLKRKTKSLIIREALELYLNTAGGKLKQRIY